MVSRPPLTRGRLGIQSRVPCETLDIHSKPLYLFGLIQQHISQDIFSLPMFSEEHISQNPQTQAHTYSGVVPGNTDAVFLGYTKRNRPNPSKLSTVEKNDEKRTDELHIRQMQRRACTHNFPDRAHSQRRVRHTRNRTIRLVIKLRTNEPTKAFTAMEKIRNVPSITNTQTTIYF